MKELLILLLLLGVAAVCYDDHSQRAALDAANAQISELTMERDQVKTHAVTSAPPAWFVAHLNEPPPLVEAQNTPAR